MTTPSRALTLALVLCLSLVVKLAGVAYMNRYLAWNLVAPDARGLYVPLARDLVQGKGYQIDGNYQDATRIAPGFPLMLAAVYRIAGVDVPVWWLGALNALMRVGTTLLVFALASRAFGDRAGVAAAIVHALDPWEAFWSGFVLKESLAVLLSMLAVYLVVRTLERPTWLRGAAAGAAIGFASLTRFATLGFFPALLAFLSFGAARRLFPWQTALRHAAAATLGLVLALAPWLVRNVALFGGPFVYTQAGLYFFVSNGPGAERAPDTWGYSGQSTGDIEAARSQLGLRPRSSYAEREAVLARGTFAYLATHPRVIVPLVAARFVNMWRPTFAGSSTSNLVVLGLPYCVTMLAAIAGLVAGLRGPWSSARLVLYWGVGFYVLLHAVFWSEIRYRQYVTPLLAVFAGYAAVALWDRIRTRSAP